VSERVYDYDDDFMLVVEGKGGVHVAHSAAHHIKKNT